MSGALVSIVIPCFNGERYLEPCLRSTLGQTWSSVEVVLVDDGSTDRSLELARSFEPRVRVVATTNLGAAAARNRGREASTGRFVHFLDADDVLPPHAIAEKMALLELYPDADAVYSRCFVPFDAEFDESIPVPRGFAELRTRGRLTPASGGNEALGVPCPATTPVLYRRGILERSDGFDETLRAYDNIEFTLRLYLDGARFVYVDTVGLVYRDHRAGARGTDDETYLSPELLRAFTQMVETVAARDALDSEIGDGLYSRSAEAGHTAAAHGELELAARWFELAERVRPGALPYPPALRPVRRWVDPARLSRLGWRLRRTAGKLGIRPRTRRRP